MAASRNNQAVLYSTQPNKYTGAESQFRGALDLWTKSYGPEHPHVGDTLTSLGMLYCEQGRFSEAEDALKRAVAIQRASLPSHHPSLAASQNALSELYNTLARFDDAKRLADNVRDTLDRSLVHLWVANLRAEGLIAAGRGKFVDAAVSYRKALESAKNRLPDDHPFVAALLESLSEVDILRSEYKETEELAHNALTIFTDKLGEHHPQTARALDTYGLVLLHQNRRPDAQKQFDQAREILIAVEKEQGSKLPEQARNLAALAALHPKRTWRDAVTEYRQALAVEVALFGAASPPTGPETAAEMPGSARYLHQMGRLYAKNGKTPADAKQAAALYAQSLAISDARLPDTHPAIAAVLEDYAELLRKAGEKKQAEAYSKRAEQIRARQPKEES